MDDDRTIERVAASVATSDRIAVLTGAGISTESGIPDFRGPNGVWTRQPEKMRLVSIGPYLEDPQVRVEAWQERTRHPAWTARPSAGHRALVDLERTGRLRGLITQNIDGLHQAAGSSPELVLELHGTIHVARCLSCGRRTPMEEQLERVRNGDPDPRCTACGGIQKSATVSFGEALDPDVLDAASNAAAACDLFVAIGTSLTVHPAAGLVAIARDAGARTVIVNAEPTPYDRTADAVLRGTIGEILPAIVRGPA